MLQAKNLEAKHELWHKLKRKFQHYCPYRTQKSHLAKLPSSSHVTPM